MVGRQECQRSLWIPAVTAGGETFTFRGGGNGRIAEKVADASSVCAVSSSRTARSNTDTFPQSCNHPAAGGSIC